MVNGKNQRLCIWAGVPMCTLWGGGFVLAGFMPPPSPEDTGAELAKMFAEDTTSIRIGLVLVVLGTALLAAFCGVISVHMKRIEGRHSPLTYTQLILAACLVLEFIFPLLFLQGAAYREGRSHELILAMDDVAWLMFVGIVSTAALQVLVIGIAILGDPRPVPIFPRWLGFVNIWVALTFCTGNVIFFVKDGPLAWNGVFAWWLVAVAFGVWITSMTVMLLKAVDRQEAVPAIDEDDAELDFRRRFELLEAEMAAMRGARESSTS